jgi:hypothetical protein
MRIALITLFILLQFNNAYSNQLPNTEQEYLITPNSVGKIRIGMRAERIQRFLDQDYKLQDQERAEVDSISLYKGKEEMFQMFFRDVKDIADCHIDLKKMLTKKSCVVNHIEIYNEKFVTKEGVHAGMTVAEAEKIYGKATLSGPSEIESEEYASFENAPKTLSAKIDYCQALKTPMQNCKINAITIVTP